MNGVQFVFVFGSNLAGRHGKGAALYAKQHFGAEYGVGVGRTGNAYAIPTKDRELRTLSLEVVEEGIKAFIEYARERAREAPYEIFILTPIGCGLAGHAKANIAEIFKRLSLPENVLLSNTWVTD
ncbi:A1S_2505 family phage non-structural protein [Roseibium aggregatum]|uniref:Macro domain-containing protein n=1 Tax=Roseibium aggregatum TaxID=187304 RepID=A0A0M6Y6G5_9HYPH|nr:hypothetical protein [Roseibium aggregatum]CTQ45696.1 hypothetical protein LAL4801_04151 [Roseibium aggregatum]